MTISMRSANACSATFCSSRSSVRTRLLPALRWFCGQHAHLALKGIHLDVFLPFAPVKFLLIGQLDASQPYLIVLRVFRTIRIALRRVALEHLLRYRPDITEPVRKQRAVKIFALRRKLE